MHLRFPSLTMSALNSQLNLHELKKKKQFLKDLVFGYNRKYEKLLDITTVIPPLVSYVCLAFYGATERFDKYGDKIYYDKALNMVKKMDDNWFAKNSPNSVFGSVSVRGKDKFIYQWTLKIINKSDWDIYIGIYQSNKIKHSINADYSRNIKYSYCFGNARLFGHDRNRKYGTKINKGDVVGMALNVPRRTLSYSLNYKNQGIAFKNIDFSKNKKYKLAISL